MFSRSSASKLSEVTTDPTADVCPPLKPQKILYLISDLSIGGAELALYRLLATTDRQRFEPVVVTLMDRGSLRTRARDGQDGRVPAVGANKRSRPGGVFFHP